MICIWTADLKAGEKAGNFEQSFNRFAPPVDYNVIWLDQDTAIEYDCGSTLFIENYCIHFMSKTPTIAPEKLQSMKDYAGDFFFHHTPRHLYIQLWSNS